MKVSRTAAWLGRSLGTCALAVGLAGGLGLTAASVASASTGTGYLRLAHLSPNTPAVDVYLYSFGDPSAMVVLHHVGYGDVSPYEAVNSGEYTVAMRAAGRRGRRPSRSCPRPSTWSTATPTRSRAWARWPA